MKKVVLVGAMLMAAGFSYAQTLIPRVGVTLSKVAASEDIYGDVDFKSKIGFTIGVGYQIPVSEVFSVQPELNFVQKGFKIEDSYTESGDGGTYTESQEAKVTMNYLEIPVLAKFTFGTDTKFYVNAGPSVGYGLGGKFKSEYTETFTNQDGTFSESESYDGKVKFGDNDDEDEEDLYFDNRVDVGVQLGAGVILMDKFIIDVRYGAGLTNLFDDVEDMDAKSKNNVLQFSVAYQLGF